MRTISGRGAVAAAPRAIAPRKPFPAYFVQGYCDPWPSKQDMRRLLSAHGLEVTEGDYALNVWIEGRRFRFQLYGGDIGEPEVEADDHDWRRLLADAEHVSAALTAAGLSHRFEVWEKGDGNEVGSVHHRMPEAPDLD
ncbi:hypothetical protein [Pseudomonas sp. CGJS7]|uniref:hypothetical protein n=1 Tax=Pseudomonas sp. CGJS7 TaxID=3109348 RepID=UPI003008A477